MTEMKDDINKCRDIMCVHRKSQHSKEANAHWTDLYIYHDFYKSCSEVFININ